MIPAKLAEILDDLNLFPDRAERIQALISLGEEFRNPTTEEMPRTGDRRVPGCESEVFVTSLTRADGTLDFRFAVDNPQGISAMALARILDQGLSGAPLDQVVEVSDELVYQIFGRELSMGKSLGLTGMIRMVKFEAGKAMQNESI
jgi:cysteine desulfuration protein SufE